MIEHIRSFSFFDPELLHDRIELLNITREVRDQGFEATMSFITNLVKDQKAGLITIDSFRGIKHILNFTERSRSTIFDLAARLSVFNCITLFVGEYTDGELETAPEFAVADGIINLSNRPVGLRDRRYLRIVKMRGVAHLNGLHPFKLTEDGLTVFPRQESLIHSPEYRATDERVSFGVPDLDALCSGGAIKSSSTLVAGGPGTGKTLLGLHFLAQHGKAGAGLMIAFQENSAQLLARAESFGLKGRLGIGEGHTRILALSPVELTLDEAALVIRRAVDEGGVRRLVLDSVAELESAAEDKSRFDDFLASMVGFFRQREVTTLMTKELPQLFGGEITITSEGLSYIVDNIIMLRYVEVGSELKRAIGVLKMRGSDHDKGLRQFTINSGGVHIGEKFDGLEGIVTGIPQPRPRREE
jgi:circadian clock protein KaiC